MYISVPYSTLFLHSSPCSHSSHFLINNQALSVATKNYYSKYKQQEQTAKYRALVTTPMDAREALLSRRTGIARHSGTPLQARVANCRICKNKNNIFFNILFSKLSPSPGIPSLPIRPGGPGSPGGPSFYLSFIF